MDNRERALGLCDKKQYEHSGPHECIPERGQKLPPFPCVNWRAGEARAAIEGEPSSESVELLVGALEGIAAGHDCACDHDDENCCERVEEYCPKCIAEVALEKWKWRAERVLEAPPRGDTGGGRSPDDMSPMYSPETLARIAQQEQVGAAPLPTARELSEKGKGAPPTKCKHGVWIGHNCWQCDNDMPAQPSELPIRELAQEILKPHWPVVHNMEENAAREREVDRIESVLRRAALAPAPEGGTK